MVWPSISILTGALKSRSSDATGSASTSTKTNVSSSALKRSTVVVPRSPSLPMSFSGRSFPSGPSSPTAIGIRTGFPLVFWEHLMLKVRSEAV